MTAWGRAEQTVQIWRAADLTVHQDLPQILNDAKCLFLSEQSTTFNPSLFCLLPPHDFVKIFFYLFKADIYGLYQAWKGKQLTEIMGFYFTAV